MSFKSFVTHLTIICSVLFVPVHAVSQTAKEAQLTKAIQTFDKGNYKEAESMFKSLINESPDDFMINYFYGACRTENGHYSIKDLNYLKKASQEVSPLDIDYYLGVQYQAQENWEQAIKHYNKYSKTAGPEDLEKVKLPEKIQQCYDNVNPYTVEEIAEDTTSVTNEIPEDDIIVAAGVKESQNLGENVNDSTNNIMALSVANPDSIMVQEEELEPVKVTPAPTEERINFSINSEITYRLLSQFKTTEGKELFEEAGKKQEELDKTLKTLDFLREKYASTYRQDEKDSIGQKILTLENYSYELKNETNQMLVKSKSLENGYWQDASSEEITDFIAEAQNVQKTTVNKNITDNALPTDTEKVTIPDILVENQGTVSKTTEPGTSDLIYKIQIGAYSRGIPRYKKALFDKISLIRKIENYTDEKGVVVYTTGNLKRFEDALVLQKQVRQEGIDDAFIVPYLKGKRITLEQAKEIEGIL